ncbi:MAG: Tm-1-like ATP-binding domain-containing protein [Dehalococcoidales bacterium]
MNSIDREGNDFYDPVADQAYIDSLKVWLRKDIEIKEIDAPINDEEFSKAVVNEFMDIISD